MPIVTQVKVRQPADQDLVAKSFVVAGIGAGFEGTIGMRVVDHEVGCWPRGAPSPPAGWQASGSSRRC